MSKFKLIALDLDGTLLNSNKELTPKTYEALKFASEQGIEVVPCTGRFFNAMPEPVRTLPFVNYAVTINGASIYNNKTKENLVQKTFSKERAKRLIEWMNQYDIAYDAYIDDTGYISSSFYGNIENYIESDIYINIIHRDRIQVDDLCEFIKNNEHDVEKIQCYTQDQNLIIKLFNEGTLLFPDFNVTSSQENNIEFTDIHASKGISLVEFANSIGIKASEIMAFGDGGNDIPMFDKVGFAVAMGNAREQVKAHSDYVTKDCDSDGIAFALHELVFK